MHEPCHSRKSFWGVLNLSHVLFVLVSLTSGSHSGRYPELGQDIGLKHNPSHNNRYDPPVVHFEYPYHGFCAPDGISKGISSNRRGSRPRDARIRRTRLGGSKSENSSRCRNRKNCTKKRTEACTCPKPCRRGIRTPLVGQKEIQVFQRFFRICCTEIHRWA
jgi:hypothetical protein